MKLTSSYRGDLGRVADLLKSAAEAGGGLVAIGALEKNTLRQAVKRLQQRFGRRGWRAAQWNH
jgi:hypothetical protein